MNGNDSVWCDIMIRCCCCNSMQKWRTIECFDFHVNFLLFKKKIQIVVLHFIEIMYSHCLIMLTTIKFHIKHRIKCFQYNNLNFLLVWLVCFLSLCSIIFETLHRCQTDSILCVWRCRSVLYLDHLKNVCNALPEMKHREKKFILNFQ